MGYKFFNYQEKQSPDIGPIWQATVFSCFQKYSDDYTFLFDAYQKPVAPRQLSRNKVSGRSNETLGGSQTNNLAIMAIVKRHSKPRSTQPTF